MPQISDNLEQVRQKIASSCDLAGRDPQEVTLLAVSKTKPIESVRSAYSCGQTHFGENYLQEAVDKIIGLQDLPITWHFIGPIQSNKTRQVAEHFAWAHSVDRSKIASRLNDQRPEELPPLQVCIQVNVDGDHNKSGCSPEEAKALAQQISVLPNLRLRGLMTIPAQGNSLTAFRQLGELLAELNTIENLYLDTLSMGMSQDLDLAIQAGATIVRIGTAIFGERAKTPE